MKNHTIPKHSINGIHYCEAMLWNPQNLGGLEAYDGSCRNKAKHCVNGVHLCGMHFSPFTDQEYNNNGTRSS